MNPIRQIFALVRHEFIGSWLFVFFAAWMWFFLAALPLAELFFEGRNESKFNFTPYVVLTILASYLYVPGMVRRGGEIIENWSFILTRAISRKQYFQAKMLIVLVAGFFPLLPVLGVSLVHDELTVRMRDADKTRNGISVTEFAGIFPQATVQNNDWRKTLVIPQAAPLAAAFSMVLMIMVFAATQFVCTWCWRFRPSTKNWHGLIAYLPMNLLLLLLFLPGGDVQATHTRWFLFFAEHWLSLTLAALCWAGFAYWFAQRRFEQLEVL